MDTPLDLSKLWFQPTMRDRFNVRIGTVYEWRANTTDYVKGYLRDCGHNPDVVDVAGLTDKTWTQLRRQLGCKRPFTLPRSALPLPLAFLGGRPVWHQTTMEKWAIDTKRMTSDKQARRATPPGRPVGVIEKHPRRRATKMVAA